MNIFRITVRAVMKQPFILILIAFVMLVAAIVNAFIPLMAMIIGIINMTGGSIFESVLSVLQMLIDPGSLPTLLIFLAAGTVLAAIVAGLLLPGYLLVVEDGIIEKKNKKRGLFGEGLKSHFFRFFFMTVKTMLCSAFFALFLMVAAVPAIIVTRAALATKPELMIGALFIDFITVAVVFLCLSFFRAYVYMWYIAASKGEKKPFKTGKGAADRQFWGIAMRLLAFDMTFITAIYLIYLSDNQIFRYVSGWAFTTAFFTTLAVYLVQTYRDKGDSSHQRT